MKIARLFVPLTLCLLTACGGKSTDAAQQQDSVSVSTEQTEEVVADSSSVEQQEEDAVETKAQAKKQSESFEISGDMQERVRKTRSQHLGYVFIGSKKELKKLHLLTRKTIFSKRKLSTINADLRNFQRIKMNKFSTLHIPGKSAKVLSDMPEESYTITRSGDECILTVNDQMAFWQNCNYLVVQSKEDAHEDEELNVPAKKKKKKDYTKLKQTAGVVAETAGNVVLALVEGYVTQNVLVEVATQVVGNTSVGRTALDVVDKVAEGKRQIDNIREVASDIKEKTADIKAKLKDVKSRKSAIEKILRQKGLSINSDLKELKNSLTKDQYKELKDVLKDESKLNEKLEKLNSKK